MNSRLYARQGLDFSRPFHDNIIDTNFVKVLMLQVITAKLKLETSPEQKELLREVSLAYRSGAELYFTG